MCTYAGINRSLLNSSRNYSQQAEYELGISVTYITLCDDEKSRTLKSFKFLSTYVKSIFGEFLY